MNKPNMNSLVVVITSCIVMMMMSSTTMSQSTILSSTTTTPSPKLSTTKKPTLPLPNDTMDHQYDMFKNDHTLEQLVTSAAGGNVYALLRYQVITNDGYILLLHRVVERAEWTAAKNNSMIYCRKRKPVIAAHGMTGSSMSFFINAPPLNTPPDPTVFDDWDNDDADNKLNRHHRYHNRTCGDNFAFCLLATGRYDLWLPNFRGSPFSLRHRSLSPQHDQQFWRFSFDEMAREDLPAVLKLINANTGHRSVGYVGFSQGVTIAVTLLALQPQYSDRIRPLIGWAPPIYLHNQQTPLRYLTPFLRWYQRLPFATSTQAMFDAVQRWFCYRITSMCGDVFFRIGGYSTHLNRTRVNYYLPHFNITQLAFTNEGPHFVQLFRSEIFRRFNYGIAGNFRRYYLPVPPEYPLYRIPAGYPVVLFDGRTDTFVTSEDVQLLVNHLRRIRVNVIHHIVDSVAWNHFDYILGIDAGRLVYHDTIKYLDQFV